MHDFKRCLFGTECDDNVDNTPMNGDASNFYGYMEDANELIYPCCKFTKLSVIVHLLHIKRLNSILDKAFAMLLDLLKELEPNESEVTRIISC